MGNISLFHVSYLDAASRLIVAQKTQSFNPHLHPPTNLLQALYIADPDIVETFKRSFKKTFDMEVLLDYSGLQNFIFRVAKKFDDIPEDPQKAFPILNKYLELDVQGDGYRSFVGVILSLLLSKERIILLDEPEAFLHPAQAKELGQWIAEHSQNVPCQIIIATHNASFLSGILSTSQNVDVFRLDRTDDCTRYKKISADSTAKLAKTPIFSSQRILESVFHKGVVVCEADADRAVYQTVAIKEFNNHNILFIHAHNKQTIKTVVNLLKDTGVPTCAIVDIDILNSNDDFLNLIEVFGRVEMLEFFQEKRKSIAFSIDDADENAILGNLKEAIKDFLDELIAGKHSLSGARGALNRIKKEGTKWETVKKFGLVSVPKSERTNAENLLEQAQMIGLFIVPVGELEGWMDLGTRKKNKWIIPALEALHDKKCPSALRNFIKNILTYMGETVSDPIEATESSLQ